VIVELPPVEIPGHRSSGQGSDDHPMRVLTRRAAGLAREGWDPDAREAVAWLFDELADGWHTRTSPERTAVVLDALDRGGVTGGAVAVEVGSGIGTYSPLLAARFTLTAAVDLSLAMLQRSPAGPGQRSGPTGPTSRSGTVPPMRWCWSTRSCSPPRSPGCSPRAVRSCG
jgi:hypothetical protein